MARPILGAAFRYSNCAHPHACALCFFVEGLPPHLAFLAQNNTDNGNMQPIDEERGLVRTHSLVKGGSLANRHGPHRSPLSRQPSLQNDDPEKPWLAVSTGLGDWGTDRGGPLGEVRNFSNLVRGDVVCSGAIRGFGKVRRVQKERLRLRRGRGSRLGDYSDPVQFFRSWILCVYLPAWWITLLSGMLGGFGCFSLLVRYALLEWVCQIARQILL
jgi:hypothetical protein